MGDMAELHYCYDEDSFTGVEDESEELIGTKVVHITEKAVLIMYNADSAWFPKSVIFKLEEDCMSYNYSFEPDWKPIHRTKIKPIEGDF